MYFNNIMMMPTKINKSIAALVVLALVASTALQWRSWWVADTAEWEFSSELQRKLMHHQPDSIYDKNWRALRAKGLEPETKSVQALLHARVQKHEVGVVRSLSRLHQSNSLHNITWRGLEAQGIEPGTPKFKRALKTKMKEREALLKEEQETLERQEVRRNMKDSKEVWLRGEYLISRGKYVSNTWNRGEEVNAAAVTAAADKIEKMLQREEDYQPLAVCDRPADVGSAEDFASLQQYEQCPDITQDKPILLLEGYRSFGRTGNNLIEFLHAIQEARDNDIQLGIMTRSWAMQLLLKMWMAIESDDWQAQFEQTFCVKIFGHEEELEGWDVIHKDTKELFHYTSEILLGDYIASQEYSLRTLFRNYNTGEGHDLLGGKVKDMCSGINAIFSEKRSSAIYSVIHSRSLEGDPGLRILSQLAGKSGCDPVAALEMKPDYIKSILEPLGMMKYPIVFITDGQNSTVLERLLADPDIGPMIHSVPKDECWIGGDLTLAIMSNAFIGNPASTFSGFIAKSRLALGFGHSYLFRAKDESGEWRTVCGDHCIFDKSIINAMS